MANKEFISLSLIMLTEVLGWSLILPFLPYFAEDLGASPLVVGAIIASFSVFQFFSAPIIGKLSDRYGRKPLLIISQLSTLAGFTILGFANSLFMIFLSRIVDGLFGSNMTITRAYMTDITKGKKRAKGFSYFGAVFGIGMFIGPAIGGLLSAINYSIPSFVAAGMSLLSIILTVFLLKETVKVEKKIKLKVNDFFPVKDFANGLRNKKLKSVFIEFFFFVMSFTVLTASMALFVKHQLGLGPEEVGIILMIVGLSRVIFQLTALPRLIDKYSEKRLNIIGLLVSTIAMFSILITTNRFMLYLVALMFSIGSGLTRPMMITRLSRKTSAKERGRYMGVLDSLGSVAQMTGPMIGGWVINNFYPGTIGLIAGAFMLTALLYELMYKPNNNEPI